MPSTTVQVSLLMEEVKILEVEANLQMAAAIRKREEAIARGETVNNLKQIAASTVATQMIRQVLSAMKRIQMADKKKGVKK